MRSSVPVALQSGGEELGFNAPHAHVATVAGLIAVVETAPVQELRLVSGIGAADKALNGTEGGPAHSAIGHGHIKVLAFPCSVAVNHGGQNTDDGVIGSPSHVCELKPLGHGPLPFSAAIGEDSTDGQVV